MLEVLNDLNGRLVNWWLAVRDEAEEFGWLVENTPNSEALYYEALDDMDDMTLPPIRRALAFHIVIQRSLFASDEKSGNYPVSKVPGGMSLNRWNSARVAALSRRMRDVQILCRPAIEILERAAPAQNAIIYCDPPYPTTHTSPYLHGEIDKDELTEALLAQRGFCAISGYGDEWDHLGWERYTKSAKRVNVSGLVSPRVEVLWTNRPSPNRLF